MDILAGVRDKLRFIERHYAAASEPFRETKRKIEAGEEPFEPPPFDPDTDDTEPPFLSEWIEADESLNLEGQAALKLVQSSFFAYLKSFVDLGRVPLTASGKSKLRGYRAHFLDAYGIDWDQATVTFEELEKVNLARNDLEHIDEPFGMTRRQSEEHHTRFPMGLFVDEVDKQVAESRGAFLWPGKIYVTEVALREAIRRVETFCEFLDEQRRF